MRFLNMVPTAKKKMQNYIHRHDTPAVTSPGPISPPRPPPPHAAQLPSSPLAARQNALESLKLPLPTTGRYARATVPEPTAHPINTSPHYHPMRRSRAGSDQAREAMQRDRGGQVFEDTTARQEALPREKGHTWDGASPTGSPRAGIQQRWEAESNLASLMSDSDARSISTRHGRFPDRRLEDRGATRSQPLERTGQKSEENPGPFIINKEGLFQVVGALSQPNAAIPIDPGLRNSALFERSGARPDPFRDPSKEESPSQKPRNSMRTKYPLHGDMAKRRSYAERADSFTNNGMTRSPEHYDSAADAVKVKKDRKEHEIETKRSTMFHDVDDALTDSDCMSHVPSQGDEVEAQRTPKAARQLVPTQKTLMPQKSHRTVAVQKSQKPLSSQKALLQESSLPRHGSVHGAGHRKRRLSADYDDSILASMRYSDLQKEGFDHDPARVAVQTTTLPSGGTLEEKLAYYKAKDENNQHHFFTQMSVHEWDASGDWFLEQFGNIVQQMKECRRSKRVMVERYETEISNREEAVRTKIEGIGRTLAGLRKDGEGMMKGKEVEDD